MSAWKTAGLCRWYMRQSPKGNGKRNNYAYGWKPTLFQSFGPKQRNTVSLPLPVLVMSKASDEAGTKN